jgi:hypothetical protein
MNYFAHAMHFLDEPYFAAGTGVPDWLTVADRGVRVRSKDAGRLVTDSEPRTAAVAGGILQHLRDDAHCHQSRAFAELSMQLAVAVRDTLRVDAGLQPSFLGHLLVEVLLDASLVAEDPARLEAYYRVLEAVDGLLIEQAVNRMASRPTRRLAVMMAEFRRQQILRDYSEDARLLRRLNQVMRRTKLDQLPEHFCDFLPEARRLVEDRKNELLEGIPTSRRQETTSTADREPGTKKRIPEPSA